jgi:hypothetical protein
VSAHMRIPMLREEPMSEASNESGRTEEDDLEGERQEIAELDEKLDAQADGEGLAAEVGRGEEMGLAEG